MVSNRTSSALNSEQDLASIPTAQGGLSRLAIARLKGARVPVAPLLVRVGLTPELIADPDERLSVRSQVRLLEEAAIALKDDCIGFTLAREFDLREIGLIYYVMASSQTLGEGLKRLARYSRVTNEALVFGYREGNSLTISLSYSGVPRHSDRHQIEFCMFAVLRICRALTGQNLVPKHFSVAHHRSEGISEMARFVGTKVEFGADADEFDLNADARGLPLIHADSYLNELLLKSCEAALADRKGEMSQLRTRVENAISSLLPHGRVLVEDVARGLGMSERTLLRRLSDEGLSFTEILQQLRRDLAVRYLDRPQAACIQDCVAAWLSRGQCIHACVQTLDRKDAQQDADSRRLLMPPCAARPFTCRRRACPRTGRPNAQQGGRPACGGWESCAMRFGSRPPR